jgi:hypothetical protein
LVIQKSVADQLGMTSFGTVHVAGMTGKVQCQMRRADTLQLGPMTVLRPTFMEMQLDGIVAGSPEPVVGILG